MTDTKLAPEAILSKLLDTCLKAGATDADASLGKSEGVSVEVRERALVGIERSESEGVSLRCFYGQRQASVSGSDLTEEALDVLAERCIMMAKAVPEDPYCGVAPASDLVTSPPDLDLTGDTDISNERLEQDALAAEAAALAVEGVQQVASCGSGWSKSERWVAASNGFSSYRTSGYTNLGLAAVAERDGAMERDYESRMARRLEDLPSAEEIGTIAGERTVARLGPRKVKTQTAPVIYDKRVATSLLGAFLSAISGPSVARKISFLKDRLGEQVFSGSVNLIDDPFRVRGLGSRAHDGEGRAVSRSAIIEHGVLTKWLLNGASAKQLGLKPNGYASGGFGQNPGVGVSNFYMEAGKQSPDEMMADVGEGLLVTDMFGPSINPNTGDYSVGVAGFWFEGGAIAYPVSEVTIAGDLPSMFERLVPASDLEFRGSRDAPSILIPDMSIAGE
ncbi:MAG: metallopeptidase TldD-related protein [Henriciella sp.]|nr:metallopeptidase TldD-related protein [Henriciella sp.]